MRAVFLLVCAFLPVACTAPEPAARAEAPAAARPAVAEKAAPRDTTVSDCAQRTTIQMQYCLSGVLDRAETRLQALQDSIGARAGAETAAGLKSAGESWTAYRERECEVRGGMFKGGSLQNPEILMCSIEVTDSRAAVLRATYRDVLNP
ncbi:MAG TPA: lysozyme inhibitor LprI family protein [Longimicrobium sp.]|jgi:uncharacterized protein YecT (DUF1311 family)|uniref:lysozyme inhibitor LprI family protein n=1 Tax=Longimicrobium sp. TaxID=2029185 RepID=UPI002ED7FCC4